MAKITHFGWVLTTPRKEVETNKLMCTKTFIDDQENLCRVDVLGVADIARDDVAVHQDFKDQLRRNKGWLVRNWTDVERPFYFTAKQVVWEG